VLCVDVHVTGSIAIKNVAIGEYCRVFDNANLMRGSLIRGFFLLVHVRVHVVKWSVQVRVVYCKKPGVVAFLLGAFTRTNQSFSLAKSM
jgi:hypothetical protein